jgi:uncharacterized protein YkwD
MGMRASSSGEAVIILLLSLLVLSLLFLAYRNSLFSPGTLFPNQSTATTSVSPNATITAQSTATTTAGSTTVSPSNDTLYGYSLSLINADRKQYGLSNVTLSSETSGQQHADSMLAQDYFSHWDTYGMKPYMRYTLLGGRGAVSENVAYRSSAVCTILGCTGNIEVRPSIQEMEYSMMYNDSQCCGNGHRENILDPDHNKVSIGVAYNSSIVYFAEDFEDDYVNWQNYGPSASTDEMYLSGSLPGSMSISTILISYDSPVTDMSHAQLANTSSYGYGTEVAGVVSSPLYYYPGLTSITADRYSEGGGQFDISFNMKNLMVSNGPGEYTVLIWMNESKSSAAFLGSTFTVFVGSDGSIHIPSNV